MLSKEKRAALALCAILAADGAKRNAIGYGYAGGLEDVDNMVYLFYSGNWRAFRSAEDFNFLLEKVAPHISKKDTHLRKAISPKDRLSVTIRFLATGETFNSLSFQYRIGSTTLSRIVMEKCAALTLVLREEYLKTPKTESQRKAIAKDFADKWHLPHCLGAVDGKHIFIQPPAKSGSMFYNYKSRFSIILMAVVDAHYKFVYASAGTQGRVSDAGVFAQSDLRVAMDTGLLHIPPADYLPNNDVVMPYMFIGDEAYPLRKDLMKPYPFRDLNRYQRIFNYRLSRARRVVENAFGILANLFRVFRTTICLDPDKVVGIVFACLCLHNFCETEDQMPTYHPHMWILKMPTIS